MAEGKIRKTDFILVYDRTYSRMIESVDGGECMA